MPHRPGHQSVVAKDEQIRRVHRLAAEESIVFIEATLEDPSQFEHRPLMEITQSEGTVYHSPQSLRFDRACHRDYRARTVQDR